MSETPEGSTRPLEDKVSVITGGARGVGFGIAQEFLANGATVIVTDLEQDSLDAATAKLGGESSGIVANVSNQQEVQTMYDQVIDRYGQLDAVVANAGVGDGNPLGAIREEQFDHIFNVNAKGVLFTVQGALRHLRAGSTVVIIGSTASIQALPGMSMYCGSKAAVRSFVQAWIQDIKGTGIRINVLSPGAVDTPSLRIALEGASGADKVAAAVQEMGEGNPIGRLADPREIGKAAVFLSSDASSFITGVELFVDGGMAQTG
jgi:NAD(P)-dependent dehydrogenase (short-subunit alcohol dehydrogenase family)